MSPCGRITDLDYPFSFNLLPLSRVLTVVVAPVSSISIYGRDAHDSLADIRKEVGMGVCPQHDVLFPDLTVKEHLQLFAGLKHVPPSEVEDAVRDAIATVGLTEKVHTACRNTRTWCR